MAIASVTFQLNGETVTLMETSTAGVYSATVTAPSASSGSNNSGNGPGVGANASGKGYYPGIVTVTDDAGNVVTVDVSDVSYGNILKLKVLEKTAPVAAISSPSTGAYIDSSSPTVKATITDAGSGIDPSSVYVKVDDGTAVKISASYVSLSEDGGTATVAYTLGTLDEGEHTVEVYASDFDGNVSNVATSTFTVDTIPPTLNISAPADAIKINVTSVTVAGTTNDVTSSPVTIKITVGGKSYTPEVGTDGSFSQAVDLSEGSNTISIVATDSAGKTTTVTRTVNVDTAAPVISAIELTPNPVDGGKTYTIKVTVTDA